MQIKSLLILLLLFISIVNAGETFNLDLKKSPTYLIGVQEGDRVEFELNNSKHTLIVESITESQVNLGVFTYININNENAPYYSGISKDKFLKLDVDRNQKPDLFVIYDKSNKTAAVLRFQLPVLVNKDLEVLPQSNFKDKNYLIYIFVAIFVLLLVLYFVLKGKRKEENTEAKSNF